MRGSDVRDPLDTQLSPSGEMARTITGSGGASDRVRTSLAPRTLATARLAEHWAHAQDIAVPLGIAYPDTARAPAHRPPRGPQLRRLTGPRTRIVLRMSGKKINPVFVLLCFAGLLIVGFALVGSTAAGAKIDESDADKGEVQLQLAAMLNYAIVGAALVLAGIGFQLTAGPKTAPPPIPGQGPGLPYGQSGQPRYQAAPQQQPQQAPPGQQWGQQPPGPPPAWRSGREGAE